ncbi:MULTISPECIES: hypothetical protein [Methanoculleus]|uniref:Uncharacterized protein n=2 Tax=Methanoculleus TaxID=45989 RepID=A3CRS7_METMJ|nr:MULTISPECIES: hypothetical protein [Methanoculleus]ABN56077.1 hypothetical protein Memar_0142 [Methanoculleus marisnigri JR1]UYU17555.1 hypothetical protein OH143_07495 [Methanoculleus submarinus]
MEKKRQLLPVIVVLLLTASVCPGPASANPVADGYNITVERAELTDDEYTAAVEFLRSSEHVVDTRGYLPEFKDAQHRRSWYNFLENLTSDTFDSVKPYLYPDGPVIGFGYDIEGYVGIGIVEEYPRDKASVAVDEIYTMLNGEAEKLGVEDIPVKVRTVDPDSLELDVLIDPTDGETPPAVLAEPADMTTYRGSGGAYSIFYNPVLLGCALGAVIVLAVGYYLIRRSRGKDAP